MALMNLHAHDVVVTVYRFATSLWYNTLPGEIIAMPRAAISHSLFPTPLCPLACSKTLPRLFPQLPPPSAPASPKICVECRMS
ncbi:hypothetical protein M404DRAFT_814261 [Pisolithus tinctorius Marx 270]|uniref:Uncharacterized protein n=1 Tax=Pisolithus tinctorius Marx 270 TaxID=870435 RepID=A0A0C3NVL1_PISTI|nr:hypothetical protein M404DRAFT_814261 [Pisolithus tinctorius Marx 270]